MHVGKQFIYNGEFVLNMAGLGETMFLFSIFGLYVANSQNNENFTEKFTHLQNNTSGFCIEIQPKVLSKWEKNYLIWFHKSLRENVSKKASEELPRALFMKKITWNSALANMAKKRAVECIKTKNVDLDEFIGQYTTVAVGNSDKIKLKDLLRIWKAGLSELTPDIITEYRKPELDIYDYEHLTQILWWNTEHFGCGRSIYKQNCVSNNCTEPKTVMKLVCNYFPKGNRPGEAVYINGENEGLICNYNPESVRCTSEAFKETKDEEIVARSVCAQEKKDSIVIEYRTRNRMIELWPAAGSKVTAWQRFNIKFFHLCVTLTILPYLTTYFIIIISYF